MVEAVEMVEDMEVVEAAEAAENRSSSLQFAILAKLGVLDNETAALNNNSPKDL